MSLWIIPDILLPLKEYMKVQMRAVIVMNIEWDYSYYQPWSDNEWLVDKMIAM